jgi:hypothetical protein
MSKTKTNLKIAAIALAIGVIGVIGVGQAQAQTHNSKRATSHTHSSSAAVSVPALLVFGQALSKVDEDPSAPNHAWAVHGANALRTQVGWDYSPAAPDSGWKPWAEDKARDVLFTNLWLSKLTQRLISRTYSSPDAVLDTATRLIEHTDSGQLQQMWNLANQAVQQAAASGDIVAVSDATNVHFRLGSATYLGGQGGWSIVRHGGVWFGGASGGQERIAGRVYTLDVRNGDELSHGTDQSRAVFGGQ